MNFLNELAYTLRILKKNYLYTLLCSSVLAVGIAIVLPFYVLVENLGGLKSPDFPDGNRFVAFRKDGDNLSRYDAFHYRYFKYNTTSFAELHAWTSANYTISDGEYAEAFKSAAVEPLLLEMPQTRPLRGRLFTNSDAQYGASPVAIISYDLWQSYYTGREDIIGLNSRINGEARTIVGVMPSGFRFPLAQDLWLPLNVPATANVGEGSEDLLIVGKLKADVKLAQASDEVSLAQASLLASWPEQYRLVVKSTVVPYIQILDNLGPSPQLIGVIFGSLMLLVAFNIGNLFLARGEERMGELSIRGALGASSSHIAVTLLLESFLVCCIGLLSGWLLSWFVLEWISGVIVSMGTNDNTRYDQLFWWDMSLNSSKLALSALTVLLVWLFSSGPSAWRLGRGNLSELLASGSKGLGDKRVTRLSRALVNMQLIFGCLLLAVGAIQTLGYFSATMTTTAGAEQLYLGRIVFSGSKLLTHTQQQQYLENLQQALLAEPVVQQAAFASASPSGGGPRLSYNLEDQDLKVNESYPRTYVLTVSPEYFSVFGLNLREGRFFNAGDTLETQPVVIIDQRFAALHWPNASALGKRLQLNPQTDSTWYTVAGVSTPSIQEEELDVGQVSRPVIYRSTAQYIPDAIQALVKVNSTQVTPASLFREVASKVDRDIPLSDLITLREVEISNLERNKFDRNLFVAFIFIALFITGVATYGLAARMAGRRRIETGIRMALGASRGAAMQVFIKDGFRTVATGLSLGTVAGIGGSYMILVDVNFTGTFALLIPFTLTVSFVLGVLVMLANYFPARKLVSLEPAEALRYE